MILLAVAKFQPPFLEPVTKYLLRSARPRRAHWAGDRIPVLLLESGAEILCITRHTYSVTVP